MKITSTYKNQKYYRDTMNPSLMMIGSSQIIRNEMKNYCVDVPGALHKENLQTIVYPCHKGPNQKFGYNRRTKTLRNVATKKCLTVYKGRIVQKRCGKSKTQKFERRGKQWVNLATGRSKCLDVEGGRYGDNRNPGKLIAFSCHSGQNQKFNSV